MISFFILFVFKPVLASCLEMNVLKKIIMFKTFIFFLLESESCNSEEIDPQVNFLFLIIKIDENLNAQKLIMRLLERK